MSRYICIHGHFYQPPRENAWLEAVEIQPTASPYHDWNQRVAAECYWPNAASQILDSENRVIEIENNYAKISFDFGPTLLAWLEKEDPDTYRAIIQADKQSRAMFSGHGAAISQAYNHIIMPLADARDKRTQVVWGVRDFEHRFNRKPEGMWLPETAVDLDTLDVLAEAGIKFTILAPGQASRVRRLTDKTWRDVGGGRVDITMPYAVRLPSGRNICVFFYDGPVSHGVAFRGLLRNGEEFANNLLGLFTSATRPQLVHIATDGESYGHHHRFGDMALAYALHYLENKKLARITNYAGFLEIMPPTHEVEIVENSSWSCAHGIERWRSDCGCSDHFHPGWNQAWRTPLRNALDWLRDNIAPRFQQKAREIFINPWLARDDYIDVILDRSPENVNRFLDSHSNHNLTAAERITALKLMELQRHAMLMYTSCGWFFDDLARIETVQIIQYAGRVAELSQQLFGDTTESRFLERLAQAKSNREDYGDGRQIYERFVRPAIIDLEKVAGHFAVSSSFSRHSNKEQFYCYQVETHEMERFLCGKTDVNLGRITVSSQITAESIDAEFLALFSEGGGVTAGIGPFRKKGEYKKAAREITRSCSSNDMSGLERFLGEQYKDSIFTSNSLFRDTQYHVLEKAMESTVAEIKPLFYPGLHRYAIQTPLVDDIDNPLPAEFRPLVELVLDIDLRRELTADRPDIAVVRRLVKDAHLWHITLANEQLGNIFSHTCAQKMRRLVSSPDDTATIDEMIELVDIARSLPFSVSLHRVQYLYYTVFKTRYLDLIRQPEDAALQRWIERCKQLGEKLSFKF